MIAVAINVAFKARKVRSRLVKRGVNAANKIAASIGPIVAKKVAKAEKAVSVIPGFSVPRCGLAHDSEKADMGFRKTSRSDRSLESSADSAENHRALAIPHAPLLNRGAPYLAPPAFSHGRMIENQAMRRSRNQRAISRVPNHEFRQSMIEHDPGKREPVFGKDHASTKS
jgi:hypothetical protein